MLPSTFLPKILNKCSKTGSNNNDNSHKVNIKTDINKYFNTNSGPCCTELSETGLRGKPTEYAAGIKTASVEGGKYKVPEENNIHD